MIRIKNINAEAGNFRLRSVSLTIPTGAYGILMGKTGSGKTTLLEVVCGLKAASSGRIELMGADLTNAKPAERNIGYIPQDAALFTHMNVAEQMGFALRVRKWSKSAIAERVHELAELLSITELLHRKPFGLSGGEVQRVALGRALAFRPSVLCLDEPLSALDHETRLSICDVLQEIKTQTGVTFLHITHDVNEAERLADVMLEMEAGSIVAKKG
ncbi:MAG: ABC transporter ATP-binding protein [Candidatus Hydrogenedentota bacterium]